MLWRCLMHWVGGMGILVFMLIVLPLAGGQTIYLMRAEARDLRSPKYRRTCAIPRLSYTRFTLD